MKVLCMNSAKLFPILFILSLSLSFEVHAGDQEKVSRLASLMIKGCSLSGNIQVDVSDPAGIVFITKGVEGKFKINKSEIPRIIKFLEGGGIDEKNTRECVTAYLNKVFDAALTTSDELVSKETPITMVKSGVIYDFEGCYLARQGNLECKFQVTSSLVDRFFSIYSTNSTLFDDRGNKYTSTSAVVANIRGDRNGVLNVAIIADIPTKMTVFFQGTSSKLKYISRLRIDVRSTTVETGLSVSAYLEFRNVLISK